MSPIETTTASDTEPSWDSFGIHRHDFRPHWNGDLVNISSVVLPQESEATTKNFMRQCVKKIVKWILDHREQFGKEDRFQIVIGWPKSIKESGRQAIKVGGSYTELEKISSGEQSIQMMPLWCLGVFS